MVMSCLPCSEALDALFKNGGIHGHRENPSVDYVLLPIHDHGIPEDISQKMMSFGGPLVLEFLETEGDGLVKAWGMVEEEIAALEKEVDAEAKRKKDLLDGRPGRLRVVWSWSVDDIYCVFMEANDLWHLGPDRVSLFSLAKAAAQM